MGFKSRFVIGLAGWVTLLLLAGAALILSFQMSELRAARIVAALAFVGAFVGLWQHVSRTNQQLARFVDAIRFGDFAQSFAMPGDGSGFAEVADALNHAMRNLREERRKIGDASGFYEAILDDAPIALLLVDSDGRVELGNKAARRLLTKHQGIRAEDFRGYGETFFKALQDKSVRRPRLVPLVADSVAYMVILTAAVVQRLGGAVTVVAVQPIQTELDTVEVAAQRDLVRVLTHEIMNSLTPITSLAQTAVELVEKAGSGDGCEISIALAAIQTVARRTDGLMQFVDTYRQISRSPEAKISRFQVGPWAAEVAAMFQASDLPLNLDFEFDVRPSNLVIEADPDLLFQALINLLRNAAEAAAGGHSTRPSVSLLVSPTAAGRVSIEVSDNGPGVPKSLQQDVFLPFFTTKEMGTGIGLSLVRQIALAHRGSITLKESSEGGATFQLVI